MASGYPEDQILLRDYYGDKTSPVIPRPNDLGMKVLLHYYSKN